MGDYQTHISKSSGREYYFFFFFFIWESITNSFERSRMFRFGFPNDIQWTLPSAHRLRGKEVLAIEEDIRLE